MGTYNLQYGYFALGGRGREADGEFNAKKIDKMETFVGFMKNYQKNIPQLCDAKKRFINPGFSIVFDDQDVEVVHLGDILNGGQNIGLLIYDVDVDLLNERKNDIVEFRSVVYELCSQVAAKKIDVYSMKDDLFPLSIDIMKMKGGDLFSYLGDNVVRNYARLVRFKKTIDDNPHDDVFKYAGRSRSVA